MKNNITHSLSKVPTPMAGLALGIASLGVCLEQFGSFNGHMQHIAAVIAAVLLVMLFAKFLVHKHLLKQDLSHPVLGSVVPTSAMALMVVSTTVHQFSLHLAVTLWLTAIALHGVFFVAFTIQRAKDFKLHHMVPSWFVPPVGIIVAAVTFPNVPALYPLAHALLIFGLVTYAILLPVMLYRLMFEENVPEAAKPSLAVMAAPASLSLAGYLTLVANPNPLLIAVLAGIAVLMTALIYLALIHLLRLTFTPGFSALTFPLVISSIAMYKLSDWMQTKDLLAEFANAVHIFAGLEAIIAAFVVMYVAGHYLNICIKHVKNHFELTNVNTVMINR
jgi:tellurite resistance protein TehA-like permease